VPRTGGQTAEEKKEGQLGNIEKKREIEGYRRSQETKCAFDGTRGTSNDVALGQIRQDEEAGRA